MPACVLVSESVPAPLLNTPVRKERFAEADKEGGKPLPGMHTDSYAPVPEPSIRTGVRTMSMAAMNLMPKK